MALRTNIPFVFHSDMLPLGVYKEVNETITTPSISNMPTMTQNTYYGTWHSLNSTGKYTFDISWVTPDMQMTGGLFGQTISAPNKVGYIRYGGYSRYSDINASYQAGPIGVRFYPYVVTDTVNNRFRIAINVLNYYVTDPYNITTVNVPSRSWNCTVAIYSVPNSYGN